MRKTILSTIVLIVAALGAACRSVSTPSVSEVELSAPVSVVVPQIAHIPYIAFDDGRTIPITPPAIWTREDTTSFRNWSRVRSVASLSYKDVGGCINVGDFLGVVREVSGERRAIIVRVTRYRPDGTREVETYNAPTGEPSHSHYFGADGKTEVLRTYHGPLPSDGVVKIMRVEIPDKDGGMRAYETTDRGRVLLP